MYELITTWLRIALGLFLIAISILVFVDTASLPGGVYEPLGPAAFPRFVAVVIGLLSLPLLFVGRSAGESEDGSELRQDLAVAGLALTVGYIILLSFDLDYRPVTIIYAAAMGFLLSPQSNRLRAGIVALALGAVLGLGLHFLMTSVFVVDLPG